MAQVMQSHEAHVEIQDVEEEEAAPVTTTTTTPAAVAPSNVTVMRLQPSARSLSTRIRRTAKWKLVTAMVFGLAVIAVAIGVAVEFSHGTMLSSASTEEPTTPTITVQPAAVTTDSFLKIEFDESGTAVFVVHKSNWNQSFVVYPTVDKHSSPPHVGLERGSVLLETSEYAFHFEKSSDDRFLLLIRDNNLARLSSPDDELKQAFDASQWPGYVTQVAIYSETDEEIRIPIDPFLSNGFFVSTKLTTTQFTPIPDGCASYPRNTNLLVEYEVDTGILRALYSIALLPETVMPQRIADDRIGYFELRYQQYSVDNTNDVNASLGDGMHWMSPHHDIISRRRLEIDPQTNTTKEPITFYVDPSVPSRWRNAFVRGVEAWQPAFEAIGFPNAIRAVQPGDPDWPMDYRLGDLRYNSISVMISETTYALGPSVIDPRSGEILHSDILFEYGFFDEVMGDFDMWSPVDPPTGPHRHSQSNHSHSHGQFRPCGLGAHGQNQMDRMVLSMLVGDKTSLVPDEIIGKHFSDVIMHEVGHTLGLRHNFAGSAAMSRQNLNDPAFVTTYGLSTSIMDYLPVNVFSDLQQSDVDTHKFYMETIGAYDYAAIAYGYAVIPDENPGYKHPVLSDIAQQAPVYLTDEDADAQSNPYAQSFDLSADPIDYGHSRLDLVKQLRNQTILDKIPDDASWTLLWKREHALLRLVNSTILMVQPFLGGMNITHAHRMNGDLRYEPEYITYSDQMRAMEVLVRIIAAEDQLFPDPAQYATYIVDRGYEGTNCFSPNLDYSCGGRVAVDMDHEILVIRQTAVLAALFPAIYRIVAQDVMSPISLTELLLTVARAAATNFELPRNQAVFGFFIDVLGLMSKTEADVRILGAIANVTTELGL